MNVGHAWIQRGGRGLDPLESHKWLRFPYKILVPPPPPPREVIGSMGSICFSREVHKAQWPRRLIVDLSLHLQPHFVYAGRKDLGELESS